MGTKQIAVSVDDITYNVLPGNTGEIQREGATIDDTIFGQNFRSNITGIIGWSLSANAVYKGYPGFKTTIKKAGTPTATTGEACSLVSGKTYQINTAAKQIWDRSVAPVVYDNAVDHTADVESIDFLFGKVTFKSTYTVTGPVTVDVTYLPVTSLAGVTSYSLTQSAEAIDTTDFATANANDGYRTYIPGLKTVSLETPTVYSALAAYAAILEGREEVIIEINPDGLGKSLCRGYFRALTTRQSGNVGALEEETVSWGLSVPIQATGPTLSLPYGWNHAVDSPIPTAVKQILTAWETDALLYCRYLPDGVNGYKGEGVITNFSLAGGMDSMNAFTFGASMTDAPVAVP